MSRPLVFCLGVLVGAAGGALGAWLLPGDREELSRYRTVREFAEQRYVRAPDRAKLADDALRGMLSGLDRYSRFYDADETAAMERETGGRYRGIGVVLKRPIADGRVLFPLRGSPAEKHGLRVGDRIVELDGRAFGGFEEADVREALSRDTDEPVHMAVIGLDGARRELVVPRESVVEPTLCGERMLDAERGIGYIALHAFSRETAAEFDAAFERLERSGMRALVLDLRGNGGGTLGSAITIARRFIPEGLIVSTENRREIQPYLAVPEEALHAGLPLVVLVDGESASASEVLAGALQDHRAAVVVGAPTWGKGTVQTVITFPTWHASAKVTTSFYFTPAHRNLEHGEDAPFGIAPDVLVELAPEEALQVHAFLDRQPPPVEALAALRAWEEREDVRVIDEPPDDRQLACAVDLLRGKRPDARAGRP
ncbi:MAG: S41 family peptidase [Planctomycetes bacterium]|nr:S41 family peptidase [Planctomycetota bacterium]